MAYAVISTGGKQYKAVVGEHIYVEKLDVTEEQTVNFDVLLLSDEGKITVGTPTVNNASVVCKVVRHGKGSKVIVFKYKPKKGYKKKQGHRQPFTQLEVVEIKK